MEAALQFDLDKAMAGSQLRTRDGRPAKSFRIRPGTQGGSNYRYEADVAGKWRCYTEQGTYWINHADPLDLVMTEVESGN